MIDIKFDDLLERNQEIAAELLQKWEQIVDSGPYISGLAVEEFEEKFAEIQGCKYFIGCGNGYDALELTIRSLDLPRGSEVGVCTSTYFATALAIVNCELVPIPIDANLTDFNIDANKLEEELKKGLKYLLLTHMYGACCAMDSITPLLEKYGVTLIEDCAQAHFATCQGNTVGNFGVAGCFSFYPTKLLGALGDAGGVATNCIATANKIRKLRNYGKRDNGTLGLIGKNSRLDPLQAVALSLKLPRVNRVISTRQTISNLYSRKLKHYEARVNFIDEIPGCINTRHLFPIVFESLSAKKHAIKNLRNLGIPFGEHYAVSCFNQPVLKKYRRVNNYVGDLISEYNITLPLHRNLSETDIELVVKTILNE